MRKVFIPLIMLAYSQIALFPQSEDPNVTTEKALLVSMVVRILEQSNQVVWNQTSSKTTIPGKAIRVKLTGENFLIITNLTPYEKDSEFYILLAQAEIWLKEALPQSVQYFSTFKTLLVPRGEAILFFPFGMAATEESSPYTLQMEILINPYDSAGGSSGD